MIERSDNYMESFHLKLGLKRGFLYLIVAKSSFGLLSSHLECMVGRKCIFATFGAPKCIFAHTWDSWSMLGMHGSCSRRPSTIFSNTSLFWIKTNWKWLKNML